MVELPLEPLFERVVDVPVYRDVVSFPPVRQDIAVVVERDVPGRRPRCRGPPSRRRAAGRRPRCSTSTRDEQLGREPKSVALHLVFQAADRTLTNAEADAERDSIVTALTARFGAQLRS